MPRHTASRVAKRPVGLPDGVEIELSPTGITVKGPLGTLRQDLSPLVAVTMEDKRIKVGQTEETKPAKAMSGLIRSLIQNMVTGVSVGFTRVLEITGVGFRAETKGDKLTLNIGYSNPVEFGLPPGVEAAVKKNTRITLRGIDKQLLGQTAARIRALRPPEPYKGKGIKYAEEQIRRKVGKAGVK
ncbi:MAG: 50S ribosomal protein L6 [Proteobacteria bacterium]|nr:50S ribosomal protein L6 [Pseudomonadota bacterium]MBU1740331.1 50S ribosomal protein L6 [Pseudomonadota bacterium]